MLKKVVESPFIHNPELLDIWPHRKHELLRDVQDCLEHPELEQMFLIVYKTKVVGLTGFYQYDDQVGLNWHGILKEYSGLGIGLAALKELIPFAILHYPQATYLIEELPADKEDSLKGFFLKAGFKRTDILVNKPWITSDTVWIEYRLSLK